MLVPTFPPDLRGSPNGWEDLHDVILVGASYGGMVITGVAGVVPERLAHLVYLDAFRPAPGQSAFDQLPDLPALFGEPPAETPWGWPLFADLSVFGITDPQQAAWVRAHATPMPTLTHREPLPAPEQAAGRPVDTTYVQGAATPFFNEVAEQARRDGARVLIWQDAPHMLPLTNTTRVAGLLREIAAAAATASGEPRPGGRRRGVMIAG
jgi:pimeloyl-ACP methyl ester carboxylesterase